MNPTYTLDTIAVHMALLKSGKIITFTGDDADIGNWNKGKSSIWDPENPTVSNNPLITRNLFCAGHCILPDGRLFAAGGQTTVSPLFPNGLISFLGLYFRKGADHDTHTFDPVNNKWTKHQSMPKARWYPTCITLPDGQALIVSGLWSQAHGYFFKNHFINLNYEIFNPQTNTLSTPKPFLKKIKAYPFLQVLPGGTLFVHYENKTRLLNISNFQEPPKEFETEHSGTRTYSGSASCVLLPLMPGDTKFKILIAGGSEVINPDEHSDATNSAEIFTFDSINQDNSKWEQTNPTNHKRFLSDSVVLPDGKILLVNGAGRGIADHNDITVKDIEIFDPETNTWSIHGTLEKDRLYHATALLLPDGTVVSAGSTGHEWTDPHFEKDIEIISPSYLDGDPDSRPKITNAPQEITYDEPFEVTIQSSANITKVSMIRCSSVTHTNNMDQRCLFLNIIENSGTTIKIQSPKDSTWAPPGYYMLFILDNNKIPSVGKIFKISV